VLHRDLLKVITSVRTDIVKNRTLLRDVNGLISVRTLSIYCPIWVKFGTRDVQTVLLSTASFVKIGAGTGRIFLIVSK
jgi:hypothetical protein